MVRFVHLADAHLGRRQYGLEERERDFLEAFNEAVELTLRARPEFVAFSGDLFDSYRPSPTTLVSAFVGLKRIVDSGVRVYAVAGNHDLGPVPGGGRASPLPLFEEALPGGFVNLGYSRPIAELDGVAVAGLPYTPRQEADSLRAALEAISARVRESPGREVILILHQAVKPMVPPQKAEIDRSTLDRLAFSYYAMGHVHDRNFPRKTTQRRPIAYSGSLEVVEEREADKLEVYGKGIYVVELEGGEARISPLNLRSIRPFFVFRERVDDPGRLERLADEIEGRVGGRAWDKPPVVRVSLSSARLDPRDVKAFQDSLREALEGRVLRVFVRLRRIDVGGEAEVSIEPKIDVEAAFREIIPDDRVRRLAIEIYRLYSEGKGRKELIRELEKIYEGWGA